MMLAQTRLLVPNTLPSRRDAESSTARVVMPEVKTANWRKREGRFISTPVSELGGLYPSASPAHFLFQQLRKVSVPFPGL